MLPNYVNNSPLFEKMGLVTRPQGHRGTCSVFTVVGALEYAIARYRGAGTHLSVEFLNWAGHKAVNRTVDGGFFSELWTGYQKYGICTEAEFPYQPRFNPDLQPDEQVLMSAKKAHAVPLRLRWIKEWDVTTGLTEDQFIEIKRTLASEYPVCGGFRWPKKAEWDQGVLRLCPPSEVFDGHSILLEGYRDDPDQPGGGVFAIRNSGGPSRSGYLSYAYVREYMNDAAVIELCE